jgi:transcriptional regulator with XRE-family HTH domain
MCPIFGGIRSYIGGLRDAHCVVCNAWRMADDRRERLEAAGRWLRRERHRRGYETAGALARALGVDPSRVSQYERGASAVPDERAADIAELFGMPELEVRRHLGLWVPEPSGRFATEERTVEGPVGETVVRIVRDLEADTDGLSEEESERMLQAVLAEIQRQARVALERERLLMERERRLGEREGDA